MVSGSKTPGAPNFSMVAMSGAPEGRGHDTIREGYHLKKYHAIMGEVA
jgi:hypothetical protein